MPPGLARGLVPAARNRGHVPRGPSPEAKPVADGSHAVATGPREFACNTGPRRTMSERHPSLPASLTPAQLAEPMPKAEASEAVKSIRNSGNPQPDRSYARLDPSSVIRHTSAETRSRVETWQHVANHGAKQHKRKNQCCRDDEPRQHWLTIGSNKRQTGSVNDSGRRRQRQLRQDRRHRLAASRASRRNRNGRFPTSRSGRRHRHRRGSRPRCIDRRLGSDRRSAHAAVGNPLQKHVLRADSSGGEGIRSSERARPWRANDRRHRRSTTEAALHIALPARASTAGSAWNRNRSTGGRSAGRAATGSTRSGSTRSGSTRSGSTRSGSTRSGSTRSRSTRSRSTRSRSTGCPASRPAGGRRGGTWTAWSFTGRLDAGRRRADGVHASCEVGLLFVRAVSPIQEGRSVSPGGDTAVGRPAAVKAMRVIRLVQRADRVGDVAQFAGDRGFHGIEGHHQAQNQHRRDQNEFRRDDEPAFIAKQTSPDPRHDHALQRRARSARTRSARWRQGVIRSEPGSGALQGSCKSIRGTCRPPDVGCRQGNQRGFHSASGFAAD